VDLAAIDYSPIGAEIKYDYSVINATAITIPCNGLYELPKIQNVKMVYEDHEVHAYLDSSVPVIKADTARTTYNVTGSNVTIAVIDTGIDDAHESLDDMDDNPATNDPKVIGFKDFVNFYPDPYDDYGHGTHCAGIAAGTGGSSVYKGVAPGAKLVGVKVLNAWGSGSESTVIAGIDWAVQNKDDYGIKIISMSLGRDYNNDGTTPMALACDAAVDAGIVVSVAAGNAGMWGSKTVGDPACAKKVITVGAIDDDMDIAYFSSRGPTADGRIKPEVCAVGVDVMSAEADTGSGYVPHDGTSMSTPHVAGVVALMLEYNPNLAPLEIREILRDTAVDRGLMGPDNDYGWGVVDSMFALLLSVQQEHDIKVSLPFIPEYVKINKSLPINATIFNKGLNNETNITVQLLINGSVNATKTITSLDSGANCSVNFTWTPYAEGSYNVSVYAVPVSGENITANNLVSGGINVLSNIYIIGYDTTHGERPSSWYIDIIDAIKSEGFIVSDIISGPITLSLLNNYDAIWIDERGGSWSADEKTALATYVENGGGLFVEGDELGDTTIVNVFNISYSGILGYSGESTDISMHSITRGVSSIYFSPVNSLNVNLPAIDVARDVEGNKMIGVRRYGNGKVVVISDEVLAYIYNADNGILGRNIFRWITLPPQTHDIEVSIDVPSVVEINVPTQINAVIANTGLNNETDVITDFLVDGTILESKTIPFIQNGTNMAVSFNWTPTAVGWYNVSVYATPVPGEDYFKNNLATRYVEVPKAVLTDVYADYGIDLDDDGLYNYLAIDVGVNVAEEGYYCLYGDIETLNGFYITDAKNDTHLSAGKQNITLLFNGIDIRRIDLNGPYTLCDLQLRDDYWNTLDWRLKAYNTSFYDSKEFQLPRAMFTDVYDDSGVDTDNDTDYNYLSIDIGVNVSESGYYHWYGELYDSYGYEIAYEGNSTYLENGTQIIKLNFKGLEIYMHGVDGPYYLKYLMLYDDDYARQDCRHDAHTTYVYNYTDFQRPPAEFNDVYTDNGTDTDGDGLYNYLIIDVGVDVRSAGYYRVEGRLDDNFGNYVEWRSNYTYLNTGNQTVKLDFNGIKIRQNGVNGTFDLRYLHLYNTTDWIQLDYRYYAHTTSHYNWTDFQRPPAEFNDVYVDYGKDTERDGLYDYLVVDVGVNVAEVGDYRVSGELYESGTYNSLDYASNTTYLNEGNQTVQLRFDGIRIRQNGYNGTYDLKYLELYNATYPYPTPTPTPASQLESKSTEAENISVRYGEQLDYRYYAYTTSHYNYTEFQTIPPCYTYTKEYVTYDWDAISTPEQNWTGCDDCSYNYALPWNFTFFCENHSSIQISTNGLITFPPDTSSHCCSPDLENTVAIAPFWDDLSQACGQGTNISVQNKGDRVVVVWYTGTYKNGCLDKDLFEAILYETGDIRFNYNYLNNIPYNVGAGISNGIVYYINTWGNGLSVVYTPINVTESPTTLDTGPGTYPSISGTHNGTIKPNQTITVQKLYTYPSTGTGGHSEHVRIWNDTWAGEEAYWTGYQDDWHNITFDEPFTLFAEKTYNYEIRTGSYPQIIHKPEHTTLDGSFINCTNFIDANG
jgi:serine protease AprX